MLGFLPIMMTVNADFKGNLLSLLQCIRGNGLVFSSAFTQLNAVEGRGSALGTAQSHMLSPELHCIPWSQHGVCWPMCIHVLLGTVALQHPCAAQESEMRVQTTVVNNQC